MKQSSVEIGHAVVFLLHKAPRTVPELVSKLGIYPATAKAHMANLVEEGLVRELRPRVKSVAALYGWAMKPEHEVAP